MLPITILSLLAALAADRLQAEPDARGVYEWLVKEAALRGDFEFVRWLRANRDWVLSELHQQLPAPKGSLWARFHEKAAPGPGERGYRAPKELPPGAWDGAESVPELALELVEHARRMVVTPELGQLWGVAQDPHVLEDVRQAAWNEISDLLVIPMHGATGRRLNDIERAGSAEYLALLALETLPDRWSANLALRSPRYEIRGEQARPAPDEPRPDPEGFGPLPVWVAAAILADAMDPQAELRLVNVDRDAAKAFIAKHHSQLPEWPYRTMYALGVVRGQRLVAVATAGHPTGRWADQKNVLELTRVASDGTTRNAASMLTARLLDIVQASGRGDPGKPVLFVTYQLSSEDGSTYKALADKGLRPTSFRPGSAHAKATGRRKKLKALADVDKIRWEAGPEAAPADWGLLEVGDRKL